jgi:hypothetical protein
MKLAGLLVVTTPDPRWSVARIHLLLRGFLSGFSEHDLNENYHVLPIWLHVLERFLGEAGFRIRSYVTLDGRTSLFEAKGRLRGAARFMLNAIQILIETRDPSARGMSYGVLAEKTSSPNMEYRYPSASE